MYEALKFSLNEAYVVRKKQKEAYVVRKKQKLQVSQHHNASDASEQGFLNTLYYAS
jgi:hypothetical protein